MASVIRENGSPSEEAFMDEVVLKYHPRYKNRSAENKRWCLIEAREGSFQMSALLEQTVSLRSLEIREVPLKNVDIDGMDFDDESDLKSCSLSYTSNGGGYFALTGNISSIATKVGALRVILWNDWLGRVEYYYIPADQISSIAIASGNSIRMSAPTGTGVVKKLQPFRCDTFDDMVLA